MLLIIPILAEAVSGLDVELGYPCYIPSAEGWMELTILGVRRDIRGYINFAIAIRWFSTRFHKKETDTELSFPVLLILVVATLIGRYRGQQGRLVQVIRRDAALYYIALAG